MDVEVNYARAVGGVDSVQKVVFDIKGTSLGTTVTIKAGQAFIPANSLIKSATLLVKEEFASIIKEAVDKVNTEYKLRRKLGCDVQTGQRYSQIH